MQVPVRVTVSVRVAVRTSVRVGAILGVGSHKSAWTHCQGWLEHSAAWGILLGVAQAHC